MTWKQVAQEIGGCTPGMLTNLSKGSRVGFPGVLRLIRWLDQPAARFTRVAGAWGHWGPEDRKPGEGRRKVPGTLPDAFEAARDARAEGLVDVPAPSQDALTHEAIDGHRG